MASEIVMLNSFGLLKISGPDAKKFLQGQLTCHLDDVDAKGSQLSALCQPQGRVIALFYIFKDADDYYLLLPQSMLAMTQTALKKYAVFFKTTLTDASDNFILIGVKSDATLDSTHAISIPISEGRAISVRPITAGNLVETATLSELDWHLANIFAGIPTIYPETSGKFLPHDLNLHLLNAISFNKGCYTGQEIIARMQYRGKLKNHLYHTIVTAPIAPTLGGDIYYLGSDGPRTAGNIVDIAPVADNRYEMLIITDEANAKDNHLFLDPAMQVYLTLQK